MFYNTSDIRKVKSKVKDAWSEWLGRYSWDWWTTLTFRNTITTRTANHKWCKWIRAIENELKDEVGYFRVSEVQRGREMLHFHALMLNLNGLETYTNTNWLRAKAVLEKKMSSPGDPSLEEIRQLAVRFYWMDRWNKISGFARIFKYNPTLGAKFYLTKYIAKELSDYKVGGKILRT